MKIKYLIFLLLIILYSCSSYFKNNEKFNSFRNNIYKQPLFRNWKNMLCFQHNKIIVSKESFKYTYEVKKQLVRNVTNLLNKLKIKYVIGHGNLLEIVRGDYIYHDDDIDIRIDQRDFHKWISYCKKLNSKEDKNFNLKFDGRIFDTNVQKKMVFK